ncbi:hypothetical protein WN48_08363 [Eufriesea mexicana]|uniref:Uncharacterized protein n=1 Tax=Eufriesea mexicana TaxID=516756 RepID=A0A310SAP8_9HYME|nr:hypothetical protein WN48_08363 [Eufriesea mexicana]
MAEPWDGYGVENSGFLPSLSEFSSVPRGCCVNIAAKRGGRDFSNWAGYEVVRDSELEVWLIFVVDDSLPDAGFSYSCHGVWFFRASGGFVASSLRDSLDDSQEFVVIRRLGTGNKVSSLGKALKNWFLQRLVQVFEVVLESWGTGRKDIKITALVTVNRDEVYPAAGKQDWGKNCVKWRWMERDRANEKHVPAESWSNISQVTTYAEPFVSRQWPTCSRCETVLWSFQDPCTFYG